jgi:hypothetical protein
MIMSTKLDMNGPVARLRPLVGLALVAYALALPSASQAQSAPDSASQASCARDLAALRRPTDVDAIRHAVVEAKSCPGGADALVAVWDAPPSDDVALRLLGVMSGDYRDQRMFDAMLRAASANRPRAIRLAAFRGLARYCLQDAALLYRDLSTPGLAPQHYVWVTLESREGPVSVVGSSPLAVSACQTVRSTLGSIGRGDADPIVRAIAAHLVTRLDELGKLSSN